MDAGQTQLQFLLLRGHMLVNCLCNLLAQACEGFCTYYDRNPLTAKGGVWNPLESLHSIFIQGIVGCTPTSMGNPYIGPIYIVGIYGL